MKKMTVDSSVIIASLLDKEPRHQEASQIWESILSGNNVAIMPYSVFVEVVAAIRRRTGSEELARDVKQTLLNIDNVSFVVVDQKTAEAAADLAIQTGLRGMDALVLQTAKDFEGDLVTFDDEMTKRAELVLKNT